eukprot:228077-Chlamydomonas_euryale.AAC.4
MAVYNGVNPACISSRWQMCFTAFSLARAPTATHMQGPFSYLAGLGAARLRLPQITGVVELLGSYVEAVEKLPASCNAFFGSRMHRDIRY